MSLARAIHVHGGGITAHAAAIAFKQALPGAAVSLIAASDDAPAGRWGAAGPILTDFHRKIGLDAAMFAKAARAVEVHASYFDQWGKDRLSFTIPVNAREKFVGGAALHQLWLRREQDAGHIDPAHLLADKGATSGCRFDAAEYHGLLVRMARAIGVERADAPPADEPALQIDCDDRDDSDWEDWSEWLPCFSEAAIEDRPLLNDGAIEHVERTDHGLRCRIGGRAATFMSGREPAGRCRATWTGNRISIGRAAISLPPLMGLSLSTALADILRLLRFIPPADQAGELQREYNRRTNAAHVATLEFASALFLLADQARNLPPGLAHIAGQFHHRGRLPVRELDPVLRGQWIAALIGCGLRPERIDPAALVPWDAHADQILSRAIPPTSFTPA